MKKRFRTMLFGIFALVLIGGVIGVATSNQTDYAYAATPPFNDANTANGVRIDGWNALKNMETFGRNNDSGCGFTAMAILLQYYNDNSWRLGEILPERFNYNLDSATGGNNDRANNLRADFFDRTPRFLGGLGNQIDQWFNFGVGNATVSDNQENGLNSFFSTFCPELHINATHLDISNDNYTATYISSQAMNQIDNNRPVLLTMLSYKFDDVNGGSGDGMLIKEAHVVVAYGYRIVDSEIQFLAHSGWVEGARAQTEVWFSPYNLISPFVYGIAYIDAPTEIKYNITEIADDTPSAEVGDRAIRLESLKYNHIGELKIPSHINGLPVTEIGSSAFSAQTGITSIEIPDTVIHIGDSAFEGLSNLTEVIFNNGSKLQTIGNSAFSGCINMRQFSTSAKMMTIGNNAFENCVNLTSISSLSYIQSIGTKAFKGCRALSSVYLPSNLASIGDRAFAGCSNLDLSVSSSNPKYSAQGNILYNKAKTKIIAAGKIASDITILNSVAEIAPYAFEGNSNLGVVWIQHDLEIGDYAFANCANLNSICFDSYNAPIVGTSVFLNDNFVIYVPDAALNTYKTAFAEYAGKIVSKEVLVFFVSDKVVIETKTIHSGSVISDLLTPTKTGYDFGGWYSNENFTGDPYRNGDLWETEVSLRVYAKWIPKVYSITLDADGGTVFGINPIDVAYGSSFSITTKATKEGNTLDGWYDSKGIEYITAAGESTRTWDKAENATLTARWTVEHYEITKNDDGKIVWLGKDGFSSDPCSIQYGTIIPIMSLEDEFKQSTQGFKSGKIFDHFEYNGSPIDWEKVPDLGENGAVIRISPVWVSEVHTIYFNALYNMAVKEIVAEYNANISLPEIERTGYTFNGWFTDMSWETKVTWTKMPDLTPNGQNNGSTMLFAKWEANIYGVSYDSNGGVGTMSPTTHVYDSAKNLPLCTFTRTGHTFMGWATAANASVVYSDGQSVVNLTEKQADTVTLYAVWQARTYSIIFKNLMSNMSAYPNSYTYGEGLSTMPEISSYAVTFYGWYTTSGFTQKVSSISNTKTGDITLYANYDYSVGGVSASYTQTVTDSDIFNQPSVRVDLSLGGFYYDWVKGTTLDKVKIVFSMDIWEVNDGYQDLYLYNGNTAIWSKTIEHGAGHKNTQAARYEFEIVLDISNYKSVNYLDLRFGAHGTFGDDWQFDDFEMSIYFTN